MSDHLSSSDEDMEELLALVEVPKSNAYFEEVLPQLSDEQFMDHLRLPREIVEDLANQFANSEYYKWQQGDSVKVTPLKYMTVFLWFAANEATSYRDVSDRFNITKSTLFKIVRRVTYFISNLSPGVIRWPNDLEKVEIERHFQNKNFPGVIGIIDGTHIRIDKPAEDPDSYLNRKHFYSLQVNGTDVSSFPHEDAVRTFMAAQEPIVVEVKRRTSGSPVQSRGGYTYVSTSCQTDICGIQWIDENTIDCFTHDIDLEEVTLRKCSSDEKLGLTVCYSSGSEVDTCTEVYIRDIAPQSVADRDGRLKQGDQILQVNGKDVANKEETESLFAENRKAVTLLVSRCYNRSEEYLDVEPIDSLNSPNGKSAAYQNSLIEQLVQQQSEAQHSPKNEHPAPKIPSHFVPDKLNLTNSLVRSKIDSINQEISQLDFRMQNISFKSDKRKAPQLPHIPPPESDTEHIYETIPEDSVIDGEIEPIYSCPYEPGEDNMIEQWLKVHQDEVWVAPAAKEGLNDVEDCKEEKKEPIKTKSKPPKSNSSGEEHENSSSAYNTGGSSNSNPLTFELAATQDAKQKNVYRSTLILCPLEEKEDTVKEKESKTFCESCKRQAAAKTKKSKSSSKIISPSSPTRRVGLSPAQILSDTMYTNVANLQQTMLLQQQLFRQALIAQNPEMASTRPTTSFTSPSLTQYQFVSGSQGYTTTHQEKNTVETKMEWKVKRRPDGTRYIASRPVRNRILKNREIKISEERAGLTTEDDTISELKIGRYWTKEERKKHLEKSRERKQRQEILTASRHIEELNEDHTKSSSRKAANNIDNAAKKHRTTKSRTHKDKDGHDIVQEVVVHGTKASQTNGKLVGLLSVTTV